MTEFNLFKHFVFNGKVYFKGSGHPAHWIEPPAIEPIYLDDKAMKRIHVNRHHIAANKKDGKSRPVYTIKHKGGTIYARRLTIDGPSECVDDTGELSCGARIWIETTSPLYLVDPMSYQEVKKAFADATLEE